MKRQDRSVSFFGGGFRVRIGIKRSIYIIVSFAFRLIASGANGPIRVEEFRFIRSRRFCRVFVSKINDQFNIKHLILPELNFGLGFIGGLGPRILTITDGDRPPSICISFMISKFYL